MVPPRACPPPDSACWFVTEVGTLDLPFAVRLVVANHRTCLVIVPPLAMVRTPQDVTSSAERAISRPGRQKGDSGSEHRVRGVTGRIPIVGRMSKRTASRLLERFDLVESAR